MSTHPAAVSPAAPADSAVSAASAALAASVARLPLEAFARKPLLSGVALSPDGQSIAGLMHQPERTVLFTRPVKGRDLQPVMVSDGREFQFNWAHWKTPDRLVVSLRYAARRGGLPTLETRLLSVKTDGSNPLALVRARLGRGTHQVQDTIVDWLPEDGEHVLLQLHDDESGWPAVYKVNITTGKRTQVQGPERGVQAWLTDAQHRVRVGVFVLNGQVEVRERAPGASPWRTLWAYSTGGADEVEPLGFGADPQELFVRADHEGRSAVFSVRLDEPALPRTLKVAHARSDVEGRLLRSPLAQQVLGVSSDGIDGGGGEGDSRQDLWEPNWRALLLAIDQGLPRRSNFLVDISHDEQRYLLYSEGNAQPGEYFLGDRRSGDLEIIGQTYPWLKPKQLVGKKPLRLTARDGVVLRTYLSLPAGRALNDGGPALPMVLLPHGGPHSRDDQNFDAWTELLANRGYAVLQVNFRGSDGYGRAFREAGLKRWGLEMQDDLTDAVQWAIAQKVADPGRVAIVGGSYGGYAALMGAVKTPQLYRCAVSFAGVTDLIDLIRSEMAYDSDVSATERAIGDLWGDRAQLRATSPALQADRIQVQVLLVHGSADLVVPVDQSRNMARALQRAGKPVRYIEQEGGDHHLSRNDQRLAFFQALEAFLAEHLAAPGPASGAAAP